MTLVPSTETHYGHGRMYLVTFNWSVLQAALWQAAEAIGWVWLLVGAAEILFWVVLWRTGFRLRKLPDFFAAALAKLRGLLRLD